MTQPTMLTVADVAERLVTSDDHVLDLIRTGRLRASNVGLGRVRPRWRISPEAVDALLESQTPQPKPARRKRQAAGSTTEFF